MILIDVIEDAFIATINVLNPSLNAEAFPGEITQEIIEKAVKKSESKVYVIYGGGKEADKRTGATRYMTMEFNIAIVSRSLRGPKEATRGTNGAYAVLDALRVGLRDNNLGIVNMKETKFLSEDLEFSTDSACLFRQVWSITIGK